MGYWGTHELSALPTSVPLNTMTLKVVCTGYENRGVCSMCGGVLSRGRRAYCSKECSDLYLNLFFWPWASWEAVARAGHKCQRCGVSEAGLHRLAYTTRCYDSTYRLEVHHIIPLDGEPRTWHRLNYWANLLVVCHDCHVTLHTPSKLREMELRRLQPVLI